MARRAAGRARSGQILSLSRGGGDAAVLREFESRQSLVSGGFYLPEAKGGTD